jgi:hypothetical protein
MPKHIVDLLTQKGIVEDYLNFCTYDEISVKYSVPRWKVEDIIEDNGIKKRGLKLKRLPPDKVKILVERYKNGDGTEVLCKTFNISPYVVRQIIREAGETVRNKGQIPKTQNEQLAQICIELWKDGYSQEAIGRLQGLTQRTVSSLIRRFMENNEYQLYVKKNSQIKGGRIKTTSGYRMIKLEKSDKFWCMAEENGYVMEHRYNMSKHLGRPLTKKETVHHIDGDRLNNDISNLQLRQGRHGKGQKFVCCDCGSHNIKASEL